MGGLRVLEFVGGGLHRRVGTRNMVLPLADHTYLEVVEVLDHPASDKAPFGQAVRARPALGGGWVPVGRARRARWAVSAGGARSRPSRRWRRASGGRRWRAPVPAPTAPSCAGSRS